MRKIFRTVLCEFLGIIVMWGCLTNGWNPAELKPWPRVVLILTVISIIQMDIIILLVRQVHLLRLTGNKEYIGFVKKCENRYFDVLAENVQLQRDLAAEQGKSEINSIFMEALMDKPTFSGAKVIEQTTGQITSVDGMTREEKEREAYSLHCDGWNNAEIAEELGLSSGSVRSYISRGKKSYDQHGDPVKDKDNPNVTHFVRPENNGKSQKDEKHTSA